jgi:transcription elongation factor Elf1
MATRKIPLTNEQYLAGDANVCPFCGSLDIRGDEIEIAGKTAIQEVSCNECDAQWDDHYRLDHYEPRAIEPPGPPTYLCPRCGSSDLRVALLYSFKIKPGQWDLEETQEEGAPGIDQVKDQSPCECADCGWQGYFRALKQADE